MTSPGSGRNSIGVRVRPNSHDFIRDLRQQLAAKKYTFYVDVQARTGGATRDVREWARGPLQKIHAAVPITATFARANAEVASWRRKVAANKTFIPIHADTSAAQREIAALRAQAAQGITIQVRADTSRARSAGPARQSRSAGRDDGLLDVGKELRDNKKIADNLQKLVKDNSKITASLQLNTGPAQATFRDLLAKFGHTTIEPDLDLDTTKAKAKDAAFRREAQKDIKRDLDIDIKRARLREIELKLKRISDSAEINVRVKKGSVERTFDAFNQIEKRVGNLTVLRSLDLGPITLGKPTGLIGTLATITALAGIVPGVVTGVAALSNAFMQLAAAASIAPGAIGGIVASLSTFSIASQGVGDAFGAMFEMWNEGAASQASSAAGLVSAHNSYRNAIVDEGRAQKDVGRARREALHDLRDLNNELRGGVLNEAQAILDVQKARDRLAQGGFETNTDRLQAVLDVKKAEQSLTETREDNIGLQEKANEEGAKGVEGSDKVVNALEAQTRAAQATAAAAAGLEQATAGTTGGAFNEMLKQLSPNAQEAVLAVSGLKGEIFDFRSLLQDTMFEGVGPRILSGFKNLLPVIEPGMQSIAQGLNQNILAVFDTLESPDGKSIIERILGGTAEAQKGITGLIDPLVKSFGTLMAAGSEHLPQIVDLMTRLADRFADFITEADKSGALDKFMDEGVAALQNLADTAINLLSIINSFSKAFETAFGGDILTMISNLTGKWAEFLGSAEGQKRLNGYIADAKSLWEEWKPVLEDLPEIFSGIADGARAVLDLVLPFLKAFSSFAKEHPGAVAALIGAWLGAKVLIGALSPVLAVLNGLLKGARAIPGVVSLLNKIPKVGPALAGPGAAAAAGAGGSGLGATAAFAGAPIAIAAVGAPLLIDAATDAAKQQPGQQGIDTINSQLPAGVPPIAGFSRDKAMFEAMAQLAAQGDPAAKWIMAAAGPQAINAPGTIGSDFIYPDPAAETEVARRYLWAATHPDQTGSNFTPPASYDKGGYTPWPTGQGQIVELHGKEYVQPASTVGHYGVAAMEAVHDKRIPREVLNHYASGKKGYKGKSSAAAIKYGFDDGGENDPAAYQKWLQEQQLAASRSNAGSGSWVDALNTGINSGINVAGNLASQAAPSGPGATSADPLATTHGTPGITPGPPPGTDVAAVTDTGTQEQTMNLFGFNIPIGNTPVGWPGGQPPVGLGGGPAGPNGEAPFDIRNFGIGPGPAGSTPSDWIQYSTGLAGEFVSGLGSSLLSGALDFLGISGINAYLGHGAELLNHFIGDKGTKAQGPGAGQTAADVTDLLATADSMPANPDYPGLADMPNVFDASTGSALGGLQVNTARGKAIIQKLFPWATNIGGVRKDALHWHPDGLALDVMIPGAGGLNDPTPPAGKAQGDKLYAWLKAHESELGIDYILWQEKDHYNHLHVNFAASGFGAGGSGPAAAGPPAAAPGTPGWSSGSAGKALIGKTDRGTAIHHRYKGGLIPSFGSGGWNNPNRRGTDPIQEGLYGLGQQGGAGAWANPNRVTGGGNFNPGIALDTSRVFAYPTNPNQVTADFLGADSWADSSGMPVPGQHDPQGTGGPGGIFGRAIDWGEYGNRALVPHKLMDQGGWLMPGATMVHNLTGQPELVLPPATSSFFTGGLNMPQGAVFPPKPLPPPPLPQGPPAMPKVTPPAPQLPTPPPDMAPQPQIPDVTPQAPPPPPQGGMPDQPAQAAPGPSGSPVAVGPRAITPVKPGEGMHLHPAIQKGIASGAATIGNIAQQAASFGMAAATGGASMAAGGGGGGGMGGPSISGLIQQGGKILTNIANVGASFLVGNITGGTTANPYGVTQRGNIPSGGTRVVDGSSNHFGDVYTNNLDEYFSRKRRQEAVHAQMDLGRWGNA